MAESGMTGHDVARQGNYMNAAWRGLPRIGSEWQGKALYDNVAWTG